ncbi:MAG: AMP-binding protein [Chthoniobacterales bacterium]
MARRGDDAPMALGANLLPDSPIQWGAGGQSLLLNPRSDPALRERILSADFPDLPDHIWIASSGTSGRVKTVALSRAAIEASAAAVNRHLRVGPADRWINPLPIFHVGGLGIVARAALSQTPCHSFEKWSPEEFVRRAADCGATLSSLVPTQVHDLVNAQLRCPQNLRAIVVGGGALDESLRVRAAQLGWPLLPSYGMTETASQVATAKPGVNEFTWLPLLDHVEARVGDDGVLELRGPSLLTGWMLFGPDGSSRWEDPKIDGWFRTSDRVELRDGKLLFLGRADDLIKIRGELVDVAALERELQCRVASGLMRIDVEPDERNGFALSVVAENSAAEAEARGAMDVFPPYARPDVFRVGAIQVSPLGKKIRSKS